MGPGPSLVAFATASSYPTVDAFRFLEADPRNWSPQRSQKTPLYCQLLFNLPRASKSGISKMRRSLTVRLAVAAST